MQRRSLRSFDTSVEEDPPINLTPLIDVVFVLLIAFMILAPILDSESIDLATAGSLSNKHSPATASLTLSIKADGTLWIRGKKVEIKNLQAILQSEKQLHPNCIPQVIPEKQAPFGTYQDVKNLLEACGFAQMDVILK